MNISRDVIFRTVSVAALCDSCGRYYSACARQHLRATPSVVMRVMIQCAAPSASRTVERQSVKSVARIPNTNATVRLLTAGTAVLRTNAKQTRAPRVKPFAVRSSTVVLTEPSVHRCARRPSAVGSVASPSPVKSVPFRGVNCSVNDRHASTTVPGAVRLF